MTRAFALLLAAATLLTSCGPSGAVTEAESPADVSQQDAARGARDLVKEIYGGLRRGDIPGLQSLAVADLFAVGPGAASVFTSREDAVVALGNALRIGKKHKLNSRGLLVTAAPGGHSAWVLDSLDLDGEAYLLSAVLSESDELWVVVAIHVGRPGTAKKSPAPTALPGGVDGAAAEPVKLFRALLAAPAALPEQLSGNKNVSLAGPGAKDGARGKKAIKKLWKKRAGAGLTMSLDGAPRAALTPDGALAWIVANVDVAAGEDAPPVTQRVLALYERGDDGWRLVAVHASLGGR